MKKITTLILSMLFALSLVACGGQTDSVGKVDEDKQQTEQTDSIQQTEQVDSTQQTGTEVAEEFSPAFDNSWASNEFEQQIPEPFEGWEANVEFDGTSRWFTQGKCPYETVKAYAETLRSCGFNLNEEVNDYQETLGTNAYEFEADNKNGYHISLYEESDVVAIELTKNNSFATSQKAFDTSWADNEFEQLIPQPPFEDWYGQVSERNENFYMMSTPETGENYEEEFQAYIQLLKDYGFEVEYVEEYDRYDANDADGNSIWLECNENGVAFISIEKVSE